MTDKYYATYLNEKTLPYPFCPGCGHSVILDKLNAALVELQVDPHKTVIVTDIGCCGLSDKFFNTNAFHGLHGRALTYASGIKLADPELCVIVIMGDGGCGIGGHHLLNAARRNIGLTVLVFNNFNFGMTGGEHSVTTPPGGLTATTPNGQLERPMDICGTVALNGAGFVARSTTFEKSLQDILQKAITFDGFALVDIWELCTAYYSPRNKFTKKDLEQTLNQLDFETGILHQADFPELSQAIHQASAETIGKPIAQIAQLAPTFESQLDRQMNLLIVGDAGTKIGHTAKLLSQSAILAGMHASQRHDFPVTVQSGHSIAEVVLSPEEILYPGMASVDAAIVLFPSGLAKSRLLIEKMSADSVLYIHKDLAGVKTGARKVVLDFAPTGSLARRKTQWCIMALSVFIRREGIFPLDALRAAASLHPVFAAENLNAIEASAAIMIH